jgi:catechol 2,3-dioxygenase-like lactoylglutathione lyase family enzyme
MATESQNSETGGVNQDEGVSKSTTVPPSKGVSYLSLVGAVLVTFGLTFGLTYGLLKRDGDGDSCSQTASFSDAPTWTDPLGLRGISHISINVPDIDEAIEFYNRTIGFEIMSGGDLWGDFIFYDLQNEAFCKDAGFLDGNCTLDAVWLRHPHMNLNLELFRYIFPEPTSRLDDIPATNDLGGVRHVAIAVANVDVAFEYLKSQPDVRMISNSTEYKPLRMTPLPFKFFYWLDPYGVQWECEEGDKVVQYQIASVTRIMDEYLDPRALFKND